MIILPSPSRYLPVDRVHPPVADLRRETTAWKALVWAYADEIVLAASSLGPSHFTSEGPAMSGLGRDRIGGGAINGWYEPHSDARLIHVKLNEWFDHDRVGCQQVMWHAERRRMLPSTITVPRLRTVPVCDRHGNVLIQRSRPHSKARVTTEYCLVNFEGAPPQLAERKERAWGDLHAMLLAFLDVMSGFPLTKWKITGRGLTNVGEPLTR